MLLHFCPMLWRLSSVSSCLVTTRFKYNTVQYKLFDPEITRALLVATAVFIATVKAEHIFSSY